MVTVAKTRSAKNKEAGELRAPWKAPLWAGLGVGLVFAGLVLGFTLQLRRNLQEQSLMQMGEALEAVLLFQVQREMESTENLDPFLTAELAYSAVLESSRLRGVLALRLYDAQGELRGVLPATAVDATADPVTLLIKVMDGRLKVQRHVGQAPESLLGTAGALLTEKDFAPIEVLIPLVVGAERSFFGVAQYWIDGRVQAEAQQRVDRELVWQAGLVFLAGATVIGLCLFWAFRLLVKTQERLQRSREDLARANAELVFSAKATALGAVSAHLIHGLRNPAAGLEGFLAELRQGHSQVPDSPVWKEAHETSVRMTRLIREVTDILKEEADDTQGAGFTVGELAEALMADLRQSARQRGVELSCRLAHDSLLPARVSSLCRLLLHNLLSNAIEASPEGAVVELACRRNNGTLEIDVSDEGTGLSEAAKATLFVPTHSSKPGGSGLGLAISWQLARHLGGQLVLVRSDQEGSTFRFQIPLRLMQANET